MKSYFPSFSPGPHLFALALFPLEQLLAADVSSASPARSPCSTPTPCAHLGINVTICLFSSNQQPLPPSFIGLPISLYPRLVPKVHSLCCHSFETLLIICEILFLLKYFTFHSPDSGLVPSPLLWHLDCSHSPTKPPAAGLGEP